MTDKSEPPPRPSGVVDITGPLREGAWHYPPPYFAPRVRSLPSPDWSAAEIHQQAVDMPMQSGTYLETAAHAYPERELVEDLPLARTAMLPSVCVGVDAQPGSGIDAARLKRSIDRVCGTRSLDGAGLLVATGWSAHWFDDDFLTAGPFFTPDAIEHVLELRVSLLGADLPRFDDPQQPTGHLRRFFATPTLMLAPLYRLEYIVGSAGWLTAAPLRLAGVCASPVRAIWIPAGSSELRSLTPASSGAHRGMCGS